MNTMQSVGVWLTFFFSHYRINPSPRVRSIETIGSVPESESLHEWAGWVEVSEPHPVGWQLWGGGESGIWGGEASQSYDFCLPTCLLQACGQARCPLTSPSLDRVSHQPTARCSFLSRASVPLPLSSEAFPGPCAWIATSVPMFPLLPCLVPFATFLPFHVS